jgi:integrase
MVIKPLNAYERWLKIFGDHVPAKLLHTHKMLIRWNIQHMDELADYIVADKKLGPVTFNDRLAILKRFTKWCVKRKMIKCCPLEDVPKRKKDYINKKRDPLTDDEMTRILAALYENTYYRKYYYAFMKFMLITGVRNSEAIGLKIRDIDFTGGCIHIQKVLTKQNGKTRYKTPKTLAGIRDIPLNQQLVDMLSPICQRKQDWEYVFTTRFNNPIDNRNFNKRILKPLLRKLKIPERDLYAARHTFGTVAIEKNVDILSIAYLMGHSKPRVVLDHYAKLRNKPKTLPDIIQ